MDKNFFCAKLKSFEAQEHSRARSGGQQAAGSSIVLLQYTYP
jgi:hypothetical protein